MNIVGIVLGAGSSKRLGQPKQTLPLGGETVLSRSLAAANRSSLDRVVLVLGGAAAEARRSTDFGRAEPVYNAAYGEGCARSILAGLDTAEDCDGILLLLGDMPTMETNTIDAMLSYVERATPWAAVASYSGTVGHPFYFSKQVFPELRALHGDKAVWKIIDRERDRRIHRVARPGSVPPDIDTWDDYENVKRLLDVR